MVCTFFGHKDAPQELQGKLERVLTEYILNRNATMFYVGNQGNFDHMVKKALRSLKNNIHILNMLLCWHICLMAQIMKRIMGTRFFRWEWKMYFQNMP